jgi:predicted GTPase
MAKPEDNMNLDELFEIIQKVLDHHPILKEVLKNMRDKIKEEQSKMGTVNILIAGKTGVGKSTLVNAVFGKTVATTGAGRPVTDEIKWYEPEGLPVRLCDTKGLELAGFNKILADLEAEIERGSSSGKIEDRVHILWL